MSKLLHQTAEEAIQEAVNHLSDQREDEAIEVFLNFLNDPDHEPSNRRLLQHACDRGAEDFELEMRVLLTLPRKRAA